MYIVLVTTSDGLEHHIERDNLEKARKYASVTVRTGFSQGDLFYTPSHTVKCEIIPIDLDEDE